MMMVVVMANLIAGNIEGNGRCGFRRRLAAIPEIFFSNTKTFLVSERKERHKNMF